MHIPACLQALKAVVAKREVSDLVTALPPWIYMYRKLIMDPSRTVRSETAAVQRAFLGVVGKAVAPHLRALIGPWWLAQHDPHADAAATTRVAFQVCVKAYHHLATCTNIVCRLCTF